MPSAGELYIAHFLGPGCRADVHRWPERSRSDRGQSVSQAGFGQSVYLLSNGQARTIREVYRALASRHDADDSNANFVVQQMANGTPAVPAASAPVVLSRFSPANMSFTGLFKNVPEAGTATDAGDGGEFFTQLYAR
ncbi:MAG: hypothetical protein MO852_17260 [Candidatus Devosia euplotis]|nr:hypothetical protein [Candidatus Devosia euplotis]